MADFFGKVGDMFNKGVATVSSGSKTMVEKSKLNTVIRNLEEERRQLTENLGNIVYSMCVNDRLGSIAKDDLLDACDAITARTEQIAVQRQRIDELDAEMKRVTGGGSAISVTCSCGHTNAPGAKFCAKCGNKIL